VDQGVETAKFLGYFVQQFIKMLWAGPEQIQGVKCRFRQAIRSYTVPGPLEPWPVTIEHHGIEPFRRTRAGQGGAESAGRPGYDNCFSAQDWLPVLS
jgi:hypothetical protein